jgi:hypothetical protein
MPNGIKYKSNHSTIMAAAEGALSSDDLISEILI